MKWRFDDLKLWLTPGIGLRRYVGAMIVPAVLGLSAAMLFILWLLETNRGTRQQLSAPIENLLVSGWWQQWGGLLSIFLLLLSILALFFLMARLNAALLERLAEASSSEIAVVIHRRLALSKGVKVVTLGGGTGMSNLLRGLKHHTSNITAVVAVSDDGGSSGRLRAAFDMPAPGDLVDCLAALSDNEAALEKLLDYRLERGGELAGHTFGNLFITTLAEVEGDFARAIAVMNALLNLRGVVYPASASPITLVGTKQDGRVIYGESQMAEYAGALQSMALEPSQPSLVPDVAVALASAEMIVLGPGSLFTSVIPPLLVPSYAKALYHATAPLIYICNIMTEAGETDNFSAWQHVETIHAHLGRYPDVVLVNSTPIDNVQANRYQHVQPVEVQAEKFQAAGVTLISLPILATGKYAQHDSDKLAQWLAEFSPKEFVRSHYGRRQLAKA